MNRPRFEDIKSYDEFSKYYREILRNSDLPKIYSQEFIEDNKDKV